MGRAVVVTGMFGVAAYFAEKTAYSDDYAHTATLPAGVSLCRLLLLLVTNSAST
jgi:hypothetical protein